LLQAFEHAPLRVAQRVATDQRPTERFFRGAAPNAAASDRPFEKELPFAAHANVDADVAATAAGDTADTRCVSVASVEIRRQPLDDFAPEISKVQETEAYADRVRVVRIIRLAHERERVTGKQTRHDVLAPRETDADDLRIKIIRIADVRKPVAP